MFPFCLTTFKVEFGLKFRLLSESLTLEVAGRPCKDSCDTGLWATREGEDGVPRRTQRIRPSQRGSGSRLRLEATCQDEPARPGQGGRQVGRGWPRAPQLGTKLAWDRSYLDCYLLQNSPGTVLPGCGKNLPAGAAVSSNAFCTCANPAAQTSMQALLKEPLIHLTIQSRHRYSLGTCKVGQPCAGAGDTEINRKLFLGVEGWLIDFQRGRCTKRSKSTS